MENPDIYFPELSPFENNLLGQSYGVDDSQAILIISLNIGDGRQDKIKVYEHDDSDQLALDFCHKHKLGVKAKTLLSNEIEKYLTIAINRNSAFHLQEACKINNVQSSPIHPRRNQAFTQKSMQVKQQVKTGQSPQKRSPNRPTRCQNGTEVGNRSVKNGVRGNKRAISMYETLRDGFGDGKLGFACSKSVWVDDSPSILGSSQMYSPRKEDGGKNERSERLMKKIKYQRYKEIFQMLSPNSKGLITSETVHNLSLPPQLTNLLTPLLEELQSLKETLDFNEFYEAMEILLKALTPSEKNFLLLPSKLWPASSEPYDTKPNISPQILTNTSTSSLYNRNLQRKIDFSRKIEKVRESVQEAEMKECKFVPSVAHKRSLSSKSFKIR